MAIGKEVEFQKEVTLKPLTMQRFCVIRAGDKIHNLEKSKDVLEDVYLGPVFCCPEPKFPFLK